MSEKINVLISVIIVTYNAEQYIENTINSLYIQTMKDYEVIFIDGYSSDNTKKILTKSIEYFENIGVFAQMVSECDEGIYDAMNKGIKLANGKYGYFLNAGDLIYNRFVFENVSKKLTDYADVVYGDVIDDYGYKKKVQQAKKADDILFLMPFCHQSVFTKMALLKQYLYNTAYCYCADYDMYLRLYLDNKSFIYMNHCIAIYSRDGISSNNTVAVLRQYKEIQKKHNTYFIRQALQYFYKISIHQLRKIKHKIWRSI